MKTQYFKQDEVREYAIEEIKALAEHYDGYLSDLHHELFNTDYYIIGRYEAKQWLEDAVSDVIETIKEYEEFNFGEVTTDFSEPEKVVNMYVYIIGEAILNDSDTLSLNYDEKADKELLLDIVKDLES